MRGGQFLITSNVLLLPIICTGTFFTLLSYLHCLPVVDSVIIMFHALSSFRMKMCTDHVEEIWRWWLVLFDNDS